MIIQEGLKQADLKDLVLPMLTVDEFSSKIDDNQIIVVGFYCFEEDAAHDLSNFIERSPVNVEDTEVSPAPSKEGYYLCFVEMRRNKQFPHKLMDLLSEVSRLTTIQNWQFTSQNMQAGETEDVTLQSLTQHVKLKPVSTNKSSQIKEWFQHSSLHDVITHGDQLELRRGPISWHMQILEFGDQLPAQAMCMETASQGQAIRLERLLEGGYQAHAVPGAVVLVHPECDKYLKVQLYNH
jgi:hypothetical protein